MIAHLRGTVLEKHPMQVIVDVGGVGYDVAIPVTTYSDLPELGSEVRLRIHFHVREDAIALFGFLTAQEKLLFEKLIGVSGIGPKLALSVLSGLATTDLIAAIRGSQVAQLVRIPGVGKKTAERMVLELSDKLDSLTVGTATVPAARASRAFSALEEDVVSALLNLGSNRAQAEGAVQKAKEAGTPQEFEPLFRRSMEFLR